MFKKIIIIALVAQTISLTASDLTPKLTFLQKCRPSYWMFGINPNHPIEAQSVGGVFAKNISTSTENINLGLDKILDAEKVEKASHAAGHGFTYGAAEGAGHAIRDGAQYVRETANAHPIASTAVVVGALAWYMIPSQEQLAREAKLKREQEHHKVETERHKQEMAEIDSGTELRTCLNTHFSKYKAKEKPATGVFGRSKTREQRIPSPCNSPARKAASYNATKAASIIDGYYKYA